MLACHRAVLHPDRPGRISSVSDGHAHAAGLTCVIVIVECAYLHISLSLATLTLYIPIAPDESGIVSSDTGAPVLASWPPTVPQGESLRGGEAARLLHSVAR